MGTNNIYCSKIRCHKYECLFSYPANMKAYTFRIVCKAIVMPLLIFCNKKMHQHFHASALKVYLFRIIYGCVSY